jgi:predicted transport protein
MKAIDRPFVKIINGTTQFVIPVFQRDYSWTEVQCRQLWDDIVRIGASDVDVAHFMGSLVYLQAGDSAAGFTRWLLIDGQQRMTTLMLLLTALRRHLRDQPISSQVEDAPTAKKIDAYFLRNIYEEGDRQYKLVLRRADQLAFRALLEGEPPPANSRVVENYELFREWLGDSDPVVVNRGIGRLLVVDVTLDRKNDDPQKIFESLNSTGMDLSQTDLIRNLVLMGTPEPDQTRLYESYWAKIDDCFRGSIQVFDAFARDYMALHTRATKQARSGDIYRHFRDEFFADHRRRLGDTESVLAEMLRFARYQAAFTLSRSVTGALAESLARLNRVAETAAVLVLRLYDLHERGKTLSLEQFVDALRLLESYVVRRAICNQESRNYWQVFTAIAHGLSEQEPYESLKLSLASQRSSYAFPSDEEFQRALTHRDDIYGMRGLHELLSRIENHGSREPTNTQSYTVEHVLPQNPKLNRSWRTMLGENWETIQRENVHRLGNLTLTGYNSSYSDRAFEDKKDIKGGFKQSSVRLNQFIREQTVWTTEQIDTRGRLLAKTALLVWPPLVVDKAAVQQIRASALRARANERTVGTLAMSEKAAGLFAALQSAVRELSTDIIEVVEPRTVTYHAADADFFCEVIPHASRLNLLLNIEFNECQYRDEYLDNAADYRYVKHAQNAGGVVYRLWSPDQLEGAMKLMRQAYDIAAE